MISKYFPSARVENVFLIDYQKLYNNGFKALIFDIDSTLVPHGAPSTPEILELFNELKNIGFRILLLSNNSIARIEDFNQGISVPYIAMADKPRNNNYLKALKQLDVTKDEALVIGDQLFTDILGANRSGIKSILVDFLMYDHETKIGKKRQLEKVFLRFYAKSKYNNSLGNILKEN